MTAPEELELPRDVVAEIKQVAHRGKSPMVLEQITEAVAAFEDGRYADALGPLLHAKEEAPRSATVRELLGLVSYRLGRWKDAAREIATYRRLSERRDQDHIHADAERALGRPGKALEILQGLKPADVSRETYVEALVVAAGALRDLDRIGDAVRLLERGPIRPNRVREYHLRLWYALADALEHAGKRSDAREWWDLIYNDDPDFYDVAERRLGIGTPG